MFIVNRSRLHGEPLLPRDRSALGMSAASAAEDLLRSCPLHFETPLHDLPSLAAETGVAKLWIKDEGGRLGLGSFKALGGAYAVLRTVMKHAGERLGRPVGPDELFDGPVREIAARMTVACTTDGNHGRSLAAGARAFGCKAIVFVPRDVSDHRAAAIESFGASVVRVDGAYDDAVAHARRECQGKDWVLLQDMGWPGFDEAPLTIMQGYTVMALEALRQAGERPTHIFAQGGVGGLAGAVGAFMADALGEGRPKLILVQPALAACYLESYEAGRPIRIRRDAPTVMAMLDCHEPSEVGWRILIRIADAFMTVEEEDSLISIKRLARPAGSDPVVIGGESGVVGFAGLSAASRNPPMREAFGLGKDSRVLLFNSEGATDPAAYERLTGLRLCEIVQTVR